ncbi:phosphatase 2C-like domain-containing protein [Pilobolus umbonatus]|nr:phosphatase 2C-like domain-containing protein [Pilobolus umbonatus]
MGQILSEPITTKTTTEGGDKRVLYAVSSMQGWRSTMEDSHTAETSYDNTGASFFGVFDGHGGRAVADYSGTQLYKKIMDSAYFKNGRYEEAIRSGYYGIDEDLKNDPKLKRDSSGSTAVAAILTKEDILYVSNAGDSRIVISTRDGKSIPLTQDHKPSLLKERQRIRKAGGFVECGRVNGSLALSRALGDFCFKANPHLTPDYQAVTAEPDIIEHIMTDQDEFILLACDGIWDSMDNQEVVDFVRYKLCQGRKLASICEELMDYCLADSMNMSGVGCDNMTVMIVAFLRHRTEKQWYDWMANKKQPKLPRRNELLLETSDNAHESPIISPPRVTVVAHSQ